jgi:hypothetical protein
MFLDKKKVKGNLGVLILQVIVSSVRTRETDKRNSREVDERIRFEIFFRGKGEGGYIKHHWYEIPKIRPLVLLTGKA